MCSETARTDSGARPVSCSTGAGVISAGLQLMGRNVDHLTQSHAEIENEGTYTYTSPPPRHNLGVNADNCLEKCLFHAINPLALEMDI